MNSIVDRNRLARGWKICRFDGIFKRIERKIIVDDTEEYNCVGVRWYGNGAFVRERLLGINIARKQQWIVKSGDVLYNKLFAWKGSFAIADSSVDNCIVSDKFPTYQTDKEVVDPQFLGYFFRTSLVTEQALAFSKGGAAISKLTLNPPQFWDLTIPLPPLEEQRRIVARIEELAARVEEARGLRREAMEENEALINAYARELINAACEDASELRCWLDPDREGIQTGPFGAQLGTNDFVEDGVPVLTIGNIQYSGLKLDDLKHVSEEKAEQLARFSLKEGDLLFARMGTVGRCCLVPQKAEGWLINYHIIRVALKKTNVSPSYIYWNIRVSEDVEKYLDENIRGATRQGVNSAIVRSLPMRIPSLERQEQIVSTLHKLQSKVDALKQRQAEAAADLDALLPSILDKAFKGEL